MQRITSEENLNECFRLLDQPEVEIPRHFQFPLNIEDYLAWTEASGARVYLLLAQKDRKLPFGIVFRRDQADGSVAAMCEWCHSIRGGNQIGLLTATSNSNRRAGVHVCKDLSCKEKVKSATPSPDDMAQLQTPEDRVRKVLERMSAFAKHSLF